MTFANCCKSEFNGSHCAACHENFSSVTSFDKHRVGRQANRVCQTPARSGLVRNARGWGLPGGYERDTDG